jgi:hypothetical protein
MPQSLSNIMIHLIWSTKDRRPWLKPGICDKTHAFLAGVVRHGHASTNSIRNFPLHQASHGLVDGFIGGKCRADIRGQNRQIRS